MEAAGISLLHHSTKGRRAMRDNLRLYHSIYDRLEEFLPDERVTRRRNLALLMSGLFLAGSVHLALIVRSWPLPSKLTSLTNRLRRFLSNERLKPRRVYRPVARLVLRRFDQTEPPLRLLLDTTQLGRSHRLLTVSVAYRGRALPLAWSVVDKAKGHLSAEEQLEVLRGVAPLLEELETPPEVLLLGDSEFASAPVMRFLEAQGWSFILRLRGHYTVRCSPEAPFMRLCEMDLEQGQTRYLDGIVLTQAHRLRCHLVLHWAEGEDAPWYLASNRPVSYHTVRRYGVRMWTEELYGDLKGHGFDLEATRLGTVERLERLVLGVCLVYVWLIVLGSRVVKNGWRHLVDRKDRRDRSYFRIGWDFLLRCMRLGDPIPVKYHLYL